MNTNSTDFACLVTEFLTDYLPHHRCYSRNTILSYRDTLKLFLRFLKEEKGISLNSFYIRDFKRELVIEFLEWYRNNGAGITAANQRLAAFTWPVFICVPFAFIDEIRKAGIPGRHCSILEAWINVGGCISGTVLLGLVLWSICRKN